MPGQRHHYNQLVTTILDLKQSQGPKNSVFDLTEPELCDVTYRADEFTGETQIVVQGCEGHSLEPDHNYLKYVTEI